MEAVDELTRGREAHSAREWALAAEALAGAEASAPLEPADLELLATALFMVNRVEDHLATLERAHRAYVEADQPRRAAACAFWIGMRLFMSGEVGRGGGWLGRAQQCVEQCGDCVERGYLLLPEMYRLRAAGDMDGAQRTAAMAADVGRAFGDDDLVALATHAHGLFLIEAGRQHDGLGVLDEALLRVASGAVSPIPTGIVYCGAIDGCRTAFEPRRAQEWTAALHAWCESQPQMLAFTGDCHVHRGELLELHGEWADALVELDRAAQRAVAAGNSRVVAQAAYRRGEIMRLRGELGAAERAYREAARGGWEPQPGLALLRVAQGDAPAALATIRRLLDEAVEPGARGLLLPAAVQIMLAASDVDAAGEAAEELEALAKARASELLAAHAAHARGAVALAGGDPRAALPDLRRAMAAWQDLDAQYFAARTQLLVAEACDALGDGDSSRLDRAAAHDALAALGAPVPARARDRQGLTDRELQVLRLVAQGQTNRAIATALVLSERTIDRHVSNILAKLRVSSRAAATAYAYEHDLL
jgi:DNA-binding CsgD family transcriptional regulator